MSDVDRAIADLERLPRKNGELVFRAPWEGRAFGMTVALIGHGGPHWEEFRRILIERIAKRGRDEYYATWLDAFEQLILRDQIMTKHEIDARTREYVSMAREAVF